MEAPMGDAPETILVGVFNGSLLIDSKGQAMSDIVTHVQYRRADLPPTPEQLMADPRVRALVEALTEAKSALEYAEQWQAVREARRALAAFPAQGGT
jgi:hypothetical protein